MIGYVMLHRQILEWEWYQCPNASRVFFHLILTANYTDKKWQGVVIKRGQLITSNFNLASQLGLKVQPVRTALKKLKSSGNIDVKTTNRYSLVTIIKYDHWQSSSLFSNKQTNIPATNKKHSTNNPLTTTKKVKNINKEKIEFRMENFKKQVFEHTQYSNKILLLFFNYWTELDSKSRSIMRFENNKYFEIEKRLENWVMNERPKNNNSVIKNTNSNR